MSSIRKHIRFDWAIKRILRDKANFGILEGFLTELTGEEIKIETILESESNKEAEDGKFNRVDLLVRNSKGELIIIEVQNSHELDYFLRILFGISKAVTEYIKEGDPYSKIKKVISVNIIYFDLGQGEDYVYKGTTSFKGIHKQDILELSPSQKRLFGKEAIEQLYPEIYLIKVNQFDDLAKDSLDEWIYFFKNSEIKEEFKAKGLKEAEEKLKIVNMDEGEYKSYQRYLDNLRYQASIAETLKIEAEEKVRKDEKLEIARMMMKSNEPIEKIKLYTGLSEEEIEAL
ncbi:MAG: Rpn family recombination-promoting nuclease/putative transposase [Lewinellaceae bacterium]|nr:Rpn family recombination-promoting nuclease/putative transposase [Phaeodactylibacter sp.]MCB9039021.1 Rpn family recombination-promoting nuclease/putative transposase [Lewinellaceae bacterium]